MGLHLVGGLELELMFELTRRDKIDEQIRTHLSAIDARAQAN